MNLNQLLNIGKGRSFVFFISVCSVLTFSLASMAVDFKACDLELKNNSQLKPFLVDENEALTAEEIEQLRSFFDQNSQGRKPVMVNQSLMIINPFYVRFEFSPETQEFIGMKNIYDRGGSIPPLLEVVGKKLIARAFALSASHPLLTQVVSREITWVARFSAIRYYLQPGTHYEGLGMHRDHAQLQGIVVLKRPSGMNGGNTLIGWPERETTEVATIYKSSPPMWNTWEPDAGINHLLLFDGIHTLHGTTDFEMGSAKIDKPKIEYRDILTLTIEEK